MNFKISKREFAKQVGQVMKGIPTKKSNPILKNLFIEAKGEEVYITSTDTVFAIQTHIKTKVLEPGTVCVDAKLLDGLLKKIKLKPKQDIELGLYIEDKELVVEVESSKTKLKTANETEYPEISWTKGDISYRLGVEELADSIKQTTFSTIKTESRPILEGVLMKVEEGYSTLVTTDGYRMSLKINKVENIDGGETEALIPVDSLLNIGKVLTSNKKASIQIFMSKKEVIFEVNNVVMKTSLIEGEFLNYKRIFGMTPKTKVNLDKAPLLEILERASVFIPKNKVAVVILSAEDDLMNMKINSDTGNLEETIDANMSGESISIAFNVSYLISALQAIRGDRVGFYFTNDSSPVILEAVGNKTYKHMLLPIKVSN